MGLEQGITRAKTEGKNPKTYGLASKGSVPNFLNPLPMPDREDEEIPGLTVPADPELEQLEKTAGSKDPGPFIRPNYRHVTDDMSILYLNDLNQEQINKRNLDMFGAENPDLKQLNKKIKELRQSELKWNSDNVGSFHSLINPYTDSIVYAQWYREKQFDVVDSSEEVFKQTLGLEEQKNKKQQKNKKRRRTKNKRKPQTDTNIFTGEPLRKNKNKRQRKGRVEEAIEQTQQQFEFEDIDYMVPEDTKYEEQYKPVYDPAGPISKETFIQQEINKALEQENGNRMLEMISLIPASAVEKQKILFQDPKLAEKYMLSLDPSRRKDFFNKYILNKSDLVSAKTRDNLIESYNKSMTRTLDGMEGENTFVEGKDFSFATEKMITQQTNSNNKKLRFSAMLDVDRKMKQANFLGEMFAANGEKGLIEYYAAKTSDFNSQIDNAWDSGDKEKWADILKQKEAFIKEYKSAIAKSKIQVSEKFNNDINTLGMANTELELQMEANADPSLKAFGADNVEDVISQDTVKIARAAILKSYESPSSYDKWYSTLNPDQRMQMWEELGNVGMTDRVPERYRQQLEQGKFDLQQDQQALEANQVQRFIDSYKQDPSLFQAYWLNQDRGAREKAMQQIIKSNTQELPVEKLQESLKVDGFIPGQAFSRNAVEALNVSKFTDASPNRVKYYLEQGKSIIEAVQLAESFEEEFAGKSRSPIKHSRILKGGSFDIQMKNQPRKMFKGNIPSFANSDSIIEKLKAKDLGYEAGDVKQIPNFVYNEKEKLINPEFLNDNRIRGLGTPMMNTEGTLAISPAIVPPPRTKAFDKYVPNFARAFDMTARDAEEMLLNTPKNKNFAAGGAVPKVRRVPNFQAEERPDVGTGPAGLNVTIEGLPTLQQAAATFGTTVEQLGQKITQLSEVFTKGITTNLDGTLTVNGLSQQFQALKDEIMNTVNSKLNSQGNQSNKNQNMRGIGGVNDINPPSDLPRN